MTKRQLIDEIRRHNAGVQLQFLAQFDESSLRQYLDRLTGTPRQLVKKRGVQVVAARRLRKAS